MSGPRMTIDGRATGASASFGVVDPVTGEVFASAPDCTPEQLDEAVEAAHRARRACG
jgi:acyl-CoA reductase-like NAD-dependent aldehyde dehydrogenase